MFGFYLQLIPPSAPMEATQAPRWCSGAADETQAALDRYVTWTPGSSPRIGPQGVAPWVVLQKFPNLLHVFAIVPQRVHTQLRSLGHFISSTHLLIPSLSSSTARHLVPAGWSTERRTPPYFLFMLHVGEPCTDKSNIIKTMKFFLIHLSIRAPRFTSI